jgi:hypothetical protein
MIPLNFTILNAVGADNDIVRNVGRAIAEQDDTRLFCAMTFPEDHVGDALFAAGRNAPVHGADPLVF